ncbi:hypothetical protein [Pseudonocardia sp. Ae717_Ps2]|uniref:hypothetical protein n=1 Tax=Pseudonocardia sp. Ae717_Ps2 TaxID=1885573 RepID=UPI0011851BD9|nr:hypothetical protein [Pseudonocardia sp. Ae717_Ps2]
MSERIAITVLTALGACWVITAGTTWPGRLHVGPQAGQGRRELALHASTYAAAQAVTKWAFYRTAVSGSRGCPAHRRGGGGVVHAVIDDGRLLARFAASGSPA